MHSFDEKFGFEGVVGNSPRMHDVIAKLNGATNKTLATPEGAKQQSKIHRIDDAGLHVTVDGTPQVLDVDHVVVCAGQESVRGLYDDLLASGFPGRVHLIGGADLAAELDAKRAIKQGTELAAAL